MNFSSINIQGNIVSSEILDKIRTEENFHHQKPEAFGLARGASLRDEIGMAWALLRTHWQTYKKRLEMMPEHDSGTSLTRKNWILPFLNELGYEVSLEARKEIDGKSYAISHGANNRDDFPIHIMGYKDNLDKRRETGGPRLSPHALVQEYLNNTEHLFALVTNGKQLRLLRDATRLVRMSYLEFDLERMMEEELYSDFSILYRVLHVSRMPEKKDEGPESVIEFYHQESLASGSRIREKLSEAVEESIKTLANGFLLHPKNEVLVQHFAENRISADSYYMQQLRLIYRILFLIVLEERKLIYPNQLDEATARLRKIYFSYYSIERLRKLTENQVYIDGDKTDLWQGLKATFLLFEEGSIGEKLGIKPLGSGIFSSDAIGMLSSLEMNNRDLLKVLQNLTTFYNEQKQLVRVNYSDLDVEEFGSVYEGLLEYDPKVERIGSRWEFSFVQGDKRSSSGSHYTPEELVKPLIKHSLDYIIADKVKLSEEQKANGEWKQVKEVAPQLEHQLNTLITNLTYQYENISRFNHLEYRNRDSHPDLPIKQLISQRRIVWNDFAVAPGVSFGSSQYSGGLGKEQQQGIQSLSSDSQREPERSGDTSDSFGKSGALQGGKDKAHIRKSRHSRKTDSESSTLHLSEKQLAALWSVLPHETRHSLLATHHLLSITVCDVACGSGHILLSAARKIATELASIREGAEQPSPTYYRTALRDVIKNCIYGVDYNPLAVELCKVALWLEAHNPGEPLNFLDHHIKCGNSIVGVAHIEDLQNGIADEAFKKLPGDDNNTVKYFREKNKKERKELAGQFKIDREADVNNRVEEVTVSYGEITKMPELTPSEVEAKAVAYQKLTTGYGWMRLQQLADMQIAQFFIPKTEDHYNKIVTDGDFRTWLNGKHQITGQAPACAGGTAAKKRFFHWFLQYPTVMQNGGFDCILGNPPFLGGQKLTGTFGNPFAEFVKHQYAPIASVDLVTYFFRRIYNIIKRKGFLSLISTNTIAQGDARVGGLSVIYEKGGTINHAIRSMKWPGLAAVEVALVTIHKGQWNRKYTLDQKEVSQITSYLDDSIPLGDPYTLKENKGKSFQGSIVLGKGFVLTPAEALNLIKKDKKNNDVLFPFLTGDDLNNQIDQSPTRWVINFQDWPLRRYTVTEWNFLSDIVKDDLEKKIEKNSVIEIAPPDYDNKVAGDYLECLSIVEEFVKPERQRWKTDSLGNEIIGTYALRKPLPERWWQHGEKRPALYSTIADLNQNAIINRYSKTLGVIFSEIKTVYSDSIYVFAESSFNFYSIFTSSIHDVWAWKNSSTMGTGTIRYSGTDSFETFPFISLENEILCRLGENYNNHRQRLMQNIQHGLTKTYNAFHAKELQSFVRNKNLEGKIKKEVEKQYGKEVWYLWNHLQKTEGTCTWEEAVEGIEELRRLHKEMDNAVLEAYGWHEDTEKWGKAINLAHDFYEVDYLPENDRIRYTISPTARKEVLKRLLLLNHERYEEEIQQGLHKKADVEKFYADKGEPVPPGTQYCDKKASAYKTKSKAAKAKEAKGGYGQQELF